MIVINPYKMIGVNRGLRFFMNDNVSLGDKMPTINQQDYMQSMLQDKLNDLCVEFGIHKNIRPQIQVVYGEDSIDVDVIWGVYTND